MIITKLEHKNNNISQDNYDKAIIHALHSDIVCDSCQNSSWTIHCKYKRYVYRLGKRYTIFITRIRCNECGKTHAVLVEGMIPFHISTFDEVIEILESCSLIDSTYITKFHTYSYETIIKNFSRGYLLLFLT